MSIAIRQAIQQIEEDIDGLQAEIDARRSAIDTLRALAGDRRPSKMKKGRAAKRNERTNEQGSGQRAEGASLTGLRRLGTKSSKPVTRRSARG